MRTSSGTTRVLGMPPSYNEWLKHVPASEDLTKHGPQEKGMANHFSILALRNP